ncbi:MAG: type IV secretory system conjugative DNA transfer family protein [Bacteroidia bacterium]
MNYGLRWLRTWSVGFVMTLLWLPIWAHMNLSDENANTQIIKVIFWAAAFIILTIIPARQIYKKGRSHIVDGIRGIIYFLLSVGVVFGTAYSLWKELWPDGLFLSSLKAIGIAAAFTYLPPFFVYCKEILTENPTFRRLFIEGRGASARWGGPSTFRKFKSDGRNFIQKIISLFTGDTKISQGIYLGDACFDDNFFDGPIHSTDDAHLLTIGMTGSGKSVTSVWPNLNSYNGSIIAMDAKGEHTINYGKRREELNQKFYACDPMGITGRESARYNLLSEIDVHSSQGRKRLSAISSSLILISGSSKNKYWEESGRFILDGLMAHFLTKYPEDLHNLPAIAEAVIGKDPRTKRADPDLIKKLHLEMHKNDAAGGLPQTAATLISQAGENGYGIMTVELLNALKWATDPFMRKQISGKSDFRIADFENTPISLFYVLSFGDMVEQDRWLRASINLSLRILENFTKKPKVPILFILDELKQYGAQLSALRDGIVTLRSAGVKLWPFVQTRQQLIDCFGLDGAVDFESSATIQLYGVKDNETAKWASEKLGSQTKKKKTGFIRRKTIEKETVYLMEASTVQTTLLKDAPVQIVFPSSGLPMRLERKAFKRLRINGGPVLRSRGDDFKKTK